MNNNGIEIRQVKAGEIFQATFIRLLTMMLKSS